MNSIAPDYSVNCEQVADIKSEQIRIIYSTVPLTLFAILVNSAIFSYIQWDVVSHDLILLWFSAVNGLSIARIGLLLRFNTLNSNSKVPVIWEYITLGISVISGALWGSLAIWFFPVNDISYQIFTTFVIAGMCAGAVTTLSSMLSSSFSFIMLAMIPLIGQFFLIESAISNAICAMAILFTVMIMLTSNKLNKIIRESLLIRYKRMLAEKTIQYQAYYDELTNLPNRRFLIERLKHEIDRSVRHKKSGAVMFLDIDRFKTINDSLGHAVGDDLLQQVAMRLSKRMRKIDTIARLGGDEFIILVSEVSDEKTEVTTTVDNIAKQVLKLFEQAFCVGEHEIHVSVSIGIAIYSLDEASPDELLQKSDVAMYEAKEAGRNTSKIFMPEMQQAVNNRQIIVKDLHRALSDDEFELYYQPQVDENNIVFEVEALLRWNHPDKGIVTPDKFIGIAESNGLIINIGEWVLKTACMQFSKISAHNNVTVSINVSPRQFEEPSFVDTIKSVINETGINPKKLRLEITENMVLKNIEETIEKMQLLKSIGICFSIDDFGTGYSSLAYLKRLPVDILKIDKSFVLDVNTDPNDAIIVETIIVMARHMQIGVVAEGVENKDIFEFLKSKGCEKFQGYLFGRPVPLDELITTLGNCSTETDESGSNLINWSYSY